MAHALVKLPTMLFFIGWIAATLAFGVLGLPLMISRKAVWKLAECWCGVTLWWLRITCGITSSVEGLEHVREDMLIASKHQSAWDTIMLWKVMKNPVFVLKHELYSIPVFGWYLWRSGQIAIDRKKPHAAMQKVIAGVAHYARHGRTLIMFPEGTRLKPGEHGSFHPGIARVSAALEMEVMPVALNAGEFWPKSPLWKKPGHALLQFLPVMDACGEDQEAWMEALEKRIIDATDAIASTVSSSKNVQ